MILIYNNATTMLPTIMMAYYIYTTEVFSCPSDVYQDYTILYEKQRAILMNTTSICATCSLGLLDIWTPPILFEYISHLTLMSEFIGNNLVLYFSYY